MKPVKRSVSLAIFRPGRRAHVAEILVVRRPSDDQDLPDAWGLPAGSLKEDEDWGETVRRAGREKLGLELELGAELNRGTLERTEYTLEMRLFQARIVGGSPRVPQPVEGVTQYRSWKWADPAVLEPAAAAGSLCSKLFLTRP